MRPLRIFILEDQVITQEVLREYLEELGYEIAGIADSAAQGLELIERTDPDLAILDIKVNGPHSGIWLGEQLNIPFIYLTAFNDKRTLQEAISTRPSSYLVKPFQRSQVYASIELAVNNASDAALQQDVQNPNDNELVQFADKIVIKDGSTYFTVQLNEIRYIKADGKYIEIHTQERRFVQRNSLVKFMADLPRPYWMQTHRSIVVNTNHISSHTHSTVTVAGGAVVPLSRRYRDNFRDLI